MHNTADQSRPKWLITVPLMVLAMALLAATLPFTMLLAILLALLPGYRGAPRALLFLCSYVVCEIAGVLIGAWLWVRHRQNKSVFLAANFRLQCWWAAKLKKAAEVIFSVSFHSHNNAALDGPAAIMLPRHASIADTVLPMTYYAIPQKIRLRYVLKKELQWDPCLEIVGNRLPNYFIDRASQNSATEVAGVAHLLEDCPANQGLLLYPEGTRFSRDKHAQLTKKAQPGSDLHSQLQRWPDLLPPRLGGCLAMLKANSGHDLLFFAHSGFEGSANFVELMNGSWSHSQVHMEFWRVPFAEIPTEPEAQKTFIFAQWDHMQTTVHKLDRLRNQSQM